jgi:collagenase-like PrtC family protease
VILSRELSLDEIEAVRQDCPEMEVEVFIHGALCIAYSGRCLLSGYFNHRDPNQGTCTNSCRWDYKVAKADEDATGDIYLLEEGNRPGEWMPIEEDMHGTYILNSKDLRLNTFSASQKWALIHSRLRVELNLLTMWQEQPKPIALQSMMLWLDVHSIQC